MTDAESQAIRPQGARPKAGKMQGGGEWTVSGLGVSPGLAAGTAYVADMSALSVPRYVVAAGAVAAELDRFEQAVKLSRHQLNKLKQKSTALHGAAGEEVGYLLDAHLAMLAPSRLLRGTVARIEGEQINAEAAVQAEIDAIADAFAALDDAYLANRIEDVRVVGGRLIRNLTKTPFAAIGKLPDGTVLVADDLSPADTALMNPQMLMGFVTALGGASSHTAIMARALGLPAVLGCGALLEGVHAGDRLLVDGESGLVTVNPTPATLADFERRRLDLQHETAVLGRVCQLPSVTVDGVAVSLQANLELPRELDSARAAGAEGIGLVRTEFLYMNRDEPPDEDEQAAVLTALVEGMAQDGISRPVTVRTLDVGGDKLAYSLRGIPMESDNPALGLRAIRLSLKYRPLLETQFAAILRAAVHGPVRILLPMISTLAEVRAARTVLVETAARLRLDGVAIPDVLPPLGIMIEIPATALMAEAFAQECDFFSIGTNDLTQYTLAVDRGEEQIADLYDPMHPAVIRLLAMTALAGQAAGIPVAVCGEIAGDPRCTELLLGLGLHSLSMSPASLPRVKHRLRGLSLAKARAFAAEVLAQPDGPSVAALLDR